MRGRAGRGGPVSGIIAPDRRTGMRLVAATPAPGLQAERPAAGQLDQSDPPQGHRFYALTWFALAVVALIIYGLAVRKRFKEEAARVMELHDPRQRPARGEPKHESVETVAVGLYASCRLAGRAGVSQWHCACLRAYGVQGRGRALGARDQRVGRKRWRRPERLRQTAKARPSTAALLAPDLPLGVELIADLVRAPHFDQDDLATEKQVIAQELAKRGTRPATSYSISFRRPLSMTSRSADPFSATRDARMDNRSRSAGMAGRALSIRRD